MSLINSASAYLTFRALYNAECSILIKNPRRDSIAHEDKVVVQNSDDGSYVSPVGLAKHQSVFVRLLGENRQENFSAKVKTSSRIHVDVINFPNLIRNRNCLSIEILVESAEDS